MCHLIMQPKIGFKTSSISLTHQTFATKTIQKASRAIVIWICLTIIIWMQLNNYVKLFWIGIINISFLFCLKCSGCFVTNSLVEPTAHCALAAGETGVRSSVKRVRKWEGEGEGERGEQKYGIRDFLLGAQWWFGLTGANTIWSLLWQTMHCNAMHWIHHIYCDSLHRTNEMKSRNKKR